MKMFLLFLLTILVVTAADKCKVQHLLLGEIIEAVNGIKGRAVNQSFQVLVENVITPENCTHENFCKAFAVLSPYKAEELGLKEKEWLLPRQLLAYIKKPHCNNKSSHDQVQFFQLLENIKLCAQKGYKEPCDQKIHKKKIYE